MQEQIITIFCLCDDFLVASGYCDDKQARISTAEIMTIALVAATFFAGNQELSRQFLIEHGYLSYSISKSRFNRRLYRIPDTLWQALFALLADVHRQLNPDQEYVVDSMPIPVCDNIRIRRCKLYQDEAYRGKIASKRRYFYGIRVHLLITATGQPVEMLLAPGSVADIRAFRSMDLDLPEGAEIYADAAYTDYLFEDTLQEVSKIELIAARKSNSTRVRPGWITYLADRVRKRVETTFSLLAERLAKSVHAVTPRGFELKVFLTVLAFAITA